MNCALPLESQLLLCCAREDASGQTQNAARIQNLLRDSLDWNWIFQTAARHNLTPLLFWNLRALENELTSSSPIPSEITARLRHDFDGNSARNFFLSAQLLEILALFETREIFALAYKGPALAMAAYRNILLRPFCDLDLLLRPDGIARAGVLLARAGFAQSVHAGKARGDYAQQWAREGVVVELHWNLLAPHLALPLDLNRLWDAPETLEIGGAKVLAPAREDLVLMLAWHGYKHRWAVLEWLCAFAALARDANLNWPRVLEKATRGGSRRVLFSALFLAREIFQTPLPDGVATEMQNDKTAQSLAKQMSAILFCDLNCDLNATENAPKSEHKIAWYHLRSRERMHDKARYCWGLAQSPGEILWKK